MCWNCSPHTSMILTSATLVRSLNGDNNVISGLIVSTAAHNNYDHVLVSILLLVLDFVVQHLISGKGASARWEYN